MLFCGLLGCLNTGFLWGFHFQAGSLRGNEDRPGGLDPSTFKLGWGSEVSQGAGDNTLPC